MSSIQDHNYFNDIFLETETRNHLPFNEIDRNRLDHSRTHNLKWCSCKHCVIMPDVVDCKCCHEFKDLLGDKLNAQCITQNNDFELLCLNEAVLRTSYIRYRQYNFVNYGVGEMSLKNYRFMAYSQFTAWIQCYEKLGYDRFEYEERIVLPTCVVNEIKGVYS